MQTITHHEARFLIHYRTDQVLDAHRKEMLNAHLKDCVECAAYAEQLQETEGALRTTLRKQWSAPALPLQVMDIRERSITSGRFFDSLTTRSALIAVSLLLFIFVYSQFAPPTHGAYSPMPVGISPIPTPSLPLTSTETDLANCPMVRYEVRRGDTLQSLSRQFDASAGTIMDLNDLKAGAAPLPAVLIIPQCELTPTSTTHPPTSTTNTPSLESITYTPG
jgi:hypothetical protein